MALIHDMMAWAEENPEWAVVIGIIVLILLGVIVIVVSQGVDWLLAKLYGIFGATPP